MKSQKKTKKTVFLEEVHIKNFLSLRDVVLPLKPLTVLVGANASGKTNILKSLRFLTKTMDYGPMILDVKDFIWGGKADSACFQLLVKIDESIATYKLELKVKIQVSTKIAVEELVVNGVNVISVQNGYGKVRDEDGKNPTIYKPTRPKVALKSASDYGNKPLTSALSNFIQEWTFYDFEPDKVREVIDMEEALEGYKCSHKKPVQLTGDGSTLRAILLYWLMKDKLRFKFINEALENSINRRIEYLPDEGDENLYLSEGCENPISLNFASDGTMRLLGYQVLLNHPHIPSLIAIEEPERNLHPAALKEIASVLERLADRTQVIITTHSSQLLDAFNPESLSSGKMGVLMLQNIPGKGTQIKNLEELRKDRDALDGWIADFGIGSAIFDSELLQDITESQSCQA